jgi:hypothetical protein
MVWIGSDGKRQHVVYPRLEPGGLFTITGIFVSLGRGLRKMDWATCSSLEREPVWWCLFSPQKAGLRPHDLSSPTNQPNQSVFGAVL